MVAAVRPARIAVRARHGKGIAMARLIERRAASITATMAICASLLAVAGAGATPAAAAAGVSRRPSPRPPSRRRRQAATCCSTPARAPGTPQSSAGTP